MQQANALREKKARDVSTPGRFECRAFTRKNC